MSLSARKRPAPPREEQPPLKRSAGSRSPRALTENVEVPESNDMYCWVCHLSGVKLFCRKCSRSFHPNCVMMGDGQSYEDYSCYECLNLIAARDPSYGFKILHLFSVAEICEILKYVIRHMEVYAMPELMPFKIDPEMREEDERLLGRLPVAKTWSELIECVEREEHESVVQFKQEFYALLHRYVVINRDIYLAASEAVQRKFEKELNVLRFCPDCYLRANRMSDEAALEDREKPGNYFVSVCRLPHALVFAKYKTYPFWPGKVLHQYSAKSVKVRFFGDHTMSTCELKNTTLLSEKPPGLNKKSMSAFSESMDELREHLKELQRVLGSPVKYSPPGTSYSALQCASVLKSQMPGIVKMLPVLDFSESSFMMKRGASCGPPGPFIPFLADPVKLSVAQLIAARERVLFNNKPRKSSRDSSSNAVVKTAVQEKIPKLKVNLSLQNVLSSGPELRKRPSVDKGLRTVASAGPAHVSVLDLKRNGSKSSPERTETENEQSEEEESDPEPDDEDEEESSGEEASQPERRLPDREARRRGDTPVEEAVESSATEESSSSTASSSSDDEEVVESEHDAERGEPELDVAKQVEQPVSSAVEIDAKQEATNDALAPLEDSATAGDTSVDAPNIQVNEDETTRVEEPEANVSENASIGNASAEPTKNESVPVTSESTVTISSSKVEVSKVTNDAKEQDSGILIVRRARPPQGGGEEEKGAACPEKKPRMVPEGITITSVGKKSGSSSIVINPASTSPSAVGKVNAPGAKQGSSTAASTKRSLDANDNHVAFENKGVSFRKVTLTKGGWKIAIAPDKNTTKRKGAPPPPKSAQSSPPPLLPLEALSNASGGTKQKVFQIGSTVLSGPEVSVTTISGDRNLESPVKNVVKTYANRNKDLLVKRKDLELRRVSNKAIIEKPPKLDAETCTVEKILTASRQPQSRVTIVRSRASVGTNVSFGSNRPSPPPSTNGIAATEAFKGDSPEVDPLSQTKRVNVATMAMSPPHRRGGTSSFHKKPALVVTGFPNPLEPQVLLEEGVSQPGVDEDEDEDDILEDDVEDDDVKPDIDELDAAVATNKTSSVEAVTTSTPTSVNVTPKGSSSSSQSIMPVRGKIQVKSFASAPNSTSLSLNAVSLPAGVSVVRPQISVAPSTSSSGAQRGTDNTSPELQGLVSRCMQFLSSEVSNFLKNQLSKQGQQHQSRESALQAQVQQMKATIDSLCADNSQLQAEVAFLKNRVHELDGSGCGKDVAAPVGWLIDFPYFRANDCISLIRTWVASRSSKAIPPFSLTAAFTAAKVATNVAAVKAAFDENGGIALDDLEATLGKNAKLILKILRGKLGYNKKRASCLLSGQLANIEAYKVDRNETEGKSASDDEAIIPKDALQANLVPNVSQDVVILDRDNDSSSSSSPVSVASSQQDTPPTRIYVLKNPESLITGSGPSVLQQLTNAGSKLTVTRTSASASPATSASAATSPRKKKRRRCGKCKGCSVPNDCGECRSCANPRRHQQLARFHQLPEVMGSGSHLQAAMVGFRPVPANRPPILLPVAPRTNMVHHFSGKNAQSCFVNQNGVQLIPGTRFQGPGPVAVPSGFSLQPAGHGIAVNVAPQRHIRLVSGNQNNVAASVFFHPHHR
ncbi:unnamed protein product [Notodromas monacha]|uniref:Protein kinase C-binding protein 1 n=1 Tax=Notodromas monacha TaxID=399045 RepID=A0A7R9BIQ8_9CRUS|nr:unnamed protein product [Notodromas monacha]CAG0915372.1 unnamed protein product [Notodromas monacha]